VHNIIHKIQPITWDALCPYNARRLREVMWRGAGMRLYFIAEEMDAGRIINGEQGGRIGR
jgi:hypothetical protein